MNNLGAQKFLLGKCFRVHNPTNSATERGEREKSSVQGCLGPGANSGRMEFRATA